MEKQQKVSSWSPKHLSFRAAKFGVLDSEVTGNGTGAWVVLMWRAYVPACKVMLGVFDMQRKLLIQIENIWKHRRKVDTAPFFVRKQFTLPVSPDQQM
ncbi:hypothetical protein P609_15030 [Comamonas thiooxydans]|nr:hypothetical protein P609_15030 [Comamonas thiooxydans]